MVAEGGGGGPLGLVFLSERDSEESGMWPDTSEDPREA